MVKFLLLDLDDTILDFHKAERRALTKTLESFGLTVTDEVRQLYSRINRGYWEALERKEVTREALLTGRFRSLFEALGMTVDAAAVAKTYENNLSQGHEFFPGAEEALQSLYGKYPMYIVSNGTKRVQDGRLDSAGIRKYFDGIFISQDLGADKPDKAFFDACFAQIPGFNREKAMIVGDSLSSDIAGGKNAGIRTCWVNVRNLPMPEENKPDHTIGSLAELEALLETL